MNAYELADELQKLDARLHLINLFKDMLRQQADRIAELEKELAFMEGEYPEPTIVRKMQEFANLEQAYNRITELEALYWKEVYKNIPPQTKPLSDEEIQGYEYLIAKVFNASTQQKVVGLDRIIRAIEERHGIK